MLKVLVLTALQEELDAVWRLKPNGHSDWSQKKTVHGYLYYETEFQDNNGNSFEMIAATQPKMGKVACAAHVTKMLQFSPQLTFMTGICAGRRKKGIELGDIIIADKAFDYEVGKKNQERFEPEMSGGSPNQLIIQWINDFNSKEKALGELIKSPRPVSLRFQREWILFQLESNSLEGFEWPANKEDYLQSRKVCPNWEQALKSLLKEGLVEQVPELKITSAGRDKVKQIKTEFLISTPTPDKSESNAWLGAFATGSSVVTKNDFFDHLAQRERKVLALDMEASAFFEAVESYSAHLPCIVIKGVCDFADNEKDDAFHHFAADASAIWMLAFAQYALPLVGEDVVFDQREEIIYSVNLPRPSKTLVDRKRWHAVLQWPSYNEDSFAERNEENNHSGMEFYRLGRKQFLLEVSLCFGAYQGTYLYIYLDERERVPKWNLVKFRVIYDVSINENKLKESVDDEICGLPYFDEKNITLSVFCKARGIGDCGSLSTYKIANGNAILTKLRIKGCNDSSSELSDETNEEDIEINPEEWPLVDITKTYPAFS